MRSNYDLKAIARRARDAFNEGNQDGYLQLYDRNVVLHGPAGLEPGIDNVRKYYEDFFAAFPGIQLKFHEELVDGDKLTLRFDATGVHGGPLMGIPATGKPVSIPGITILRFRDGKCVERWNQADFLGMLQQIGAMPPPATA